jgi:hypothetical protein
MDISTVLAKHNLELSSVLSEDGLVSLSKAYNDLLETLQSDSESQAEREKVVRDSLLTEHKNPQGILDVRETLDRIIEREGENILPALVESLQEVKQDLMILRDFHVSSIARANKPERVKDDSEVEIRKQEASALREAIVSVHSLMGHPVLDVKDGETSLFKTKKNAENKIVPDLPRVPGGNTSGNVGKGAKIRLLNFEVDGEKIPAGTLLYDVVRRYLCDFKTGQVFKATDLKDLVDKTKKSFTPEGYENKWTVTIGGHKVSGWLNPSE